MQKCPCGTEKAYLDCCGVFISHQKIPATPEELMRSRYTAYHEANFDYIVETMKSPASERFDKKSARKRSKNTLWVELKILKTTQSLARGTVEFIAGYHVGNQKHSLHEVSEFRFEDGKWYYVDGIHHSS